MHPYLLLTCTVFIDVVFAFGLNPGTHLLPKLRGLKYHRRSTAVCRAGIDTTQSETTEQTVARFKKLQNQSDIRGISIAGVPGEEISLGPIEAHYIGAAFALWVHNKVSSKDIVDQKTNISVGRDCRLSGVDISNALMSGMTSSSLLDDNIHVIDVGPCTTPAMFKSCITNGYMYDGAVMVTASHLPMNRNGLKFFIKSGGLSKHDIAEIISKASELCNSNKDNLTSVILQPDVLKLSKVSFLPIYQEQLASMIRNGVGFTGTKYWKPLEGFKIVINAGNGMGGFIEDLVSSLGANTTGSMYLDPDGTFPNHLANPELPEATIPTRASVLKNEADIGIILDTDVDRSGVVDHYGNIINRNRLIAMMSIIVLRDYPGTCIVTDSTTSNGLNTFITQAGGKHIRYIKGYKNVIDKAIELNNSGIDCQLAIETSGHGALKDNYMLDDGAYMAMKILIEMARQGKGKDMSQLIHGLQEPQDEIEFRLKVNVTAGYETIDVYDKILIAFEQAVDAVPNWSIETPNYEGLRVNVDEMNNKKGWLMLRMSLHDPIIIFNVESEVYDGVARIADVLLENVLKPFETSVDLKPIRTRIAEYQMKQATKELFDSKQQYE